MIPSIAGIVVFSGDQHLRSKYYKTTDSPALEGDSFIAMAAIVARVIELKRIGNDVMFVLGGDLTCEFRPSVDIVRDLVSLLASVLSAGVDIGYVVGNHDPDVDAWCAVLGELPQHLRGESSGKLLRLEGNTVEFCGVRIGGIDHRKTSTSFSETMADLAGPETPDILVVHQGMRSLMREGAGYECDLDTWADLQDNCQLILAGHVHSPSETGVEISNGKKIPFVYSGSTYRTKFNESGGTWVEVTIADKVVTYEHKSHECLRSVATFDVTPAVTVDDYSRFLDTELSKETVVRTACRGLVNRLEALLPSDPFGLVAAVDACVDKLVCPLIMVSNSVVSSLSHDDIIKTATRVLGVRPIVRTYQNTIVKTAVEGVTSDCDNKELFAKAYDEAMALLPTDELKREDLDVIGAAVTISGATHLAPSTCARTMFKTLAEYAGIDPRSLGVNI